MYQDQRRGREGLNLFSSRGALVALYLSVSLSVSYAQSPSPTGETQDQDPPHEAQAKAHEELGSPRVAQEDERGDRAQALVEGLRLWVPFQQWSTLKQHRDRAHNTRRAEPSYQARQAHFQSQLTQRAQWDVMIPELESGLGAEQLRVQLKLVEEAKRALISRREQGLSEEIMGLDLYLSQLLSQERASLELIDELLEQQLLTELEGPPSLEPELGSDPSSLKELTERHELLSELERLVTAELSELESWRAQLSSLGRSLKSEEEGHEAELARLERLSERLTDRLSQLLMRRELEGELEALSRETLLGLLATHSTEELQARQVLDESVEGLEKLRKRYELEHRAKLRELKPPELPPSSDEEGEDSFQIAARLKRSVDTSERFARFHKERAEETRRALEAQASYLEELDQGLMRLGLSFRMTLKRDVLEARIEGLSEELIWSAAQIAARAKERVSLARLSSLNELKSQWRKERERLIEEGERWRATQREDEEASARHSAELDDEGGLRERLKHELVWLSFLQEIESYDTQQLLSAYQRDLKRLKEQDQKLDELEHRYELMSAQLEKLSEQRELLSDPLVRQYPSSDADFRRWAAPLFKLIEPQGEEPQEAEEGESDTRPTEAVASALPQEVAALTLALRARIPPRVNYYQERRQITGEISEQLSGRAQLLTELSATLNQRAELARQIWRSATLLKRRHQQEERPSFELSPEMREHRSLSWVNGIKAANISEIKSQHERQAEWLNFEPRYGELNVILEQWNELLGQILDLIERLDEMRGEVERESATQPTPQSKLEADQSAHALKLRMDRDEKWYESAWNLINSEDTKALDELLEGLYIQLTRLERKQELIDQSIKQGGLLVTRVTDQRPLLESFQEAMSGALKTLEQRLNAERMKVLVQLDPQGSLSALSEFNLDSELKVSQPNGVGLEGEERARAVMELKRSWALYQAYQRTLAQLREALATHGMLEQSVGQVKDSIARLQSERDQLARPLYRLLGSRARSLVKGERLDQVGEIDRIRDERFQKKLKAGAGIILSFCLIPLIALLLIRFMSHFGERIFVYVLREQTDKAQTERERQEREERSATLFQVFRAASSLVIWTLTGIYLLKAVQVDVTPIIASAGVLGLALAFGAQELVRDFFAGFFILLENQYNIGDIVRIQGAFGKIERITLRLTILRDEEGVVHFIPNGQVGMVSNCTREWSQARLDIGASYQAAPKQVIDCLRSVGEQLCADPIYGGYVLLCEVLGLERFDDSAVVYRVRLRVTAGQQWQVARIYRQRVMEAFEDWGIEIPFPQMVVHYSPPELEGLQSMEISPKDAP